MKRRCDRCRWYRLKPEALQAKGRSSGVCTNTAIYQDGSGRFKWKDPGTKAWYGEVGKGTTWCVYWEEKRCPTIGMF